MKASRGLTPENIEKKMKALEDGTYKIPSSSTGIGEIIMIIIATIIIGCGLCGALYGWFLLLNFFFS